MTLSPHEGRVSTSPRSSPLPASPPRYLPPHIHDEVFDAIHDSGSHSRDHPVSAASSPSDAYANLTIDSLERDTMAQDQSDPPRPPPRSSSPAKRLHSDMDNRDQHMDLDVPAGPRATKPLPARATSVEMADATPTGSSATSSEAASLANTDSTASSLPEVPTLDQQVAKVLSLHKQPLSDRQEGYVISEKWLERVFARTSENKDRPEQFDKSATQGEIGPVDNSDLVDHCMCMSHFKGDYY